MSMRQRGYWLRQADAIRRQSIAAIAYGVGAGISMVFSDEGGAALDGLELTETTAEKKKRKSEAIWDMLYFMKGGTGV
ncbi:hypothetical protein LCGC14_2697670 [marine sediment metagenome]|uniref:Uncharacterized protein n=1 Tax=marine sediment metagenome TaxID=412755 RepID=A0A0F9A473_9ZZZZ